MPDGHLAGPARVGIGGPVGSGKTALIEALIPIFISRGIEIAVVTNDLVTKEDARRLQSGGLIDPERVVAVEAGACPHTVIREDPTLNIAAADDLEARFPALDLILIESGGDNLASTFSLDLGDWWMFVIDVGQGDDIPRKRGPGIMLCDLLVVNKLDIAPYVFVDAADILSEARDVRAGKPVIGCRCKGSSTEGTEAIADMIAHDLLFREMAS
jgi:urease accessory protein